jgi:LPPG:FO 2-phospho-L-lactate transferase
MNITVLCGGVGAARFVKALLAVEPGVTVSAVVNTGDDTELHGLHISPDIDTVIYTVAGAIDPERGWGLRDESWTAMRALERYSQVRPSDSSAAPTWFNLGDQDLATHFYRTARLGEGASLCEVTAEIAQAWSLPIKVVPMTNDRVRTRVRLRDSDSVIDFQEYFVKHRHSLAVSEVTFEGAESAAFVGDAELEGSDLVVIAPSNPIVSIGPIRALGNVDERLAARRDSVVAISPIIAGAALKGPADRMLSELGLKSSVVGVAELYAPICGTLIIDSADADLASAVEATGMRCIVTNTIMGKPESDHALIQAVLGVVS